LILVALEQAKIKPKRPMGEIIIGLVGKGPGNNFPAAEKAP
jgi:hypothetical protein